ncbi:MAG: iron ABC transporter permease [Planctomycetes bacterium]|nr:iron ABC transporter permease [Planctomycetota bacterium]
MVESILRRIRGGWRWLPFALVAYGPVVWLVARTLGIGGGDLSFAAYTPLFGDDAGAAARRSTLWNSVLLAGAISGATVLAGVPFAFLVTRTDLAFRRVYAALAVVPLLLPPYLAGIAWVQVAPMRGLPAIVFILGGSLWPVVALLAEKAFRDVGADAEDAARLALGAGGALRRVTLPLARGGIVAGALLVFVFALSDFVVPDFFSFAVQSESTFQVFATEIYGAFARQRDPIAAAAFGVPLIVVAAAALLLLGRAEPIRSVASLAGAHVEPRPFRLGRLGVPAHLLVIALLAATVAVPLGVLLRMTTRTPGVPAAVTAPVVPAGAATDPQGAAPTVAPPAFGSFDYGIYRQREPVRAALVKYAPDAWHSIRDAASGALLLLLLAWAPARQLARQGGSLGGRLLVLLPLAFPSLLLGMSFEQLFLADAGIGDRLYRGWGLVALTLASRFLPLAVLGLAASFRRIAPEIEDAAQLAPLPAHVRLLRLRLPLLLPALLAVFTLAFGLMMREFDAIVLLPGAQEMLTHRIYALVHQSKDAVVGALAWLQIASVLVPWIALRLLQPAPRP